MSLFLSENPFRTIGLPSNSGLKQIQKNISKLKAFSKLEKEVNFDYDLNFLNLSKIDRTIEKITKVESRFLLDENKLKYSMFWFQKSSPFDDVALSNLIQSDTSKAIEIWDKVMRKGELNQANVSAYNNSSSLLLFLLLDSSKNDQFYNDETAISKLAIALNRKYELINSDHFNEFCSILGITSNINVGEIQLFFTETILSILNKNFTSNQIHFLIKGLNEDVSHFFTGYLVKGPLLNIKKQIETTSKILESDNTKGIVLGKSLIKNTLKDLKFLKTTLGEESYQYENLTNNLSNQILQCGINYFNKTGEDQAYLGSYKYALSIASNEKTILRAKETIQHCEEEKEANICSCCSVSPIYKNSSYNLTIYKETKRTYFPQRVEYSHGTLNLFFCKSCLAKATEKDSTSQTITWAIAIIAAIVVGIASEHIGGAILGGVIGLGLGSFIGGIFSADNSSIIRNHPNTKKYLNQGYQLNQPTA